MFKASVIIATHNRVMSLKPALMSIIHQQAEGISFEVIVVDNNSNDKTREVVQKMAEISPVLLRYSFEPVQGKSYALNRGIKEAQGEIVVFSDDDIIADRYWLMNMVQCFEHYPCDAVGGRVLPKYPQGTPQWIKDNAKILSGPIVAYDYGMGTKLYREKDMLEFLGANFAFKKDVFNEIGWFRTDLGPGRTLMGEDTDMINRMARYHKNLYYCGGALVWHPVAERRMNLRYIAQWSMCLGYCRVITDATSRPVGLKYWFGYPRYLFRVIAGQVLQLGLNVLNKPKFLSLWMDIFVNIGRAREIKRYHEKVLQKELSYETLSERHHMHV